MENDHEPAEQLIRRIPWNKGRIVGAKPPLKPSQTSGRSEPNCIWRTASVTLR